MIRALAAPYDGIARAGLVLAAAGVVVWLSLQAIDALHTRRALEARVCEAEWRALVARTPMLARVVAPADRCVAMRMVR